MFQMKEQDKAPEEELNEGELDNQPKKEFRVMIVKMIQKLGRKMDAQIDKLGVFNRENIKNNQTELNNKITEVKNTLDGI